ncbi:MAG TPA: hypothetical protein VFS03_12530, partial [Microvirga sp.]|nr:hypothetical protein [Microvirga sp.]
MLFKPTRRRTRPVSPRGRVSRDGAFEWGSVSLGALVHGLMSLQARWRRWALPPSPDGEARRDRVPEPAPAGWIEDGSGAGRERAPDRATEIPPAAEPLVYRRSRRTAAPAAAAPDAAPDAPPEREQPERESVPAPA